MTRIVVGVSLAVVATIGIAAAIMFDLDSDLETYYKKVEANMPRALREDVIVLPILPEATVTDPELRETLHREMVYPYKGEVDCMLGSGTYRALDLDQGRPLITVDYKSSDPNGCSGRFNVTQNFWSIISMTAAR